MSSLLELLPDLVFLMRRDGSILAHAGGHGVPALRLSDSRGEAPWSEATSTLMKQLVRRSIAQRGPAEARFQEGGRDYDIRVTAQGPDRAVCSIRAVLADLREPSHEATGAHPRPEVDRRGFLRRLRESMSVAALREQPLAVAVLYIDGIPDIAQVIGGSVSEQVTSAAIQRLAALADRGGPVKWYLGQLAENILALVLDTADRDLIDVCVTQVCTSLRDPIEAGTTEFKLTPYAGVGILGMDAASPKVLLEHARTAATEARRAAANRVFFYSDTLQLKSLARLDMARELREAIENRDIRFRYIGRHDLVTGRLVGWVGYLRWQHPLRGEIPPAEFLRVAGSTGLGVTLSRAALQSLSEDHATLLADAEPDVRISFGALRDHVFHESFLADMERLLAEGALPAPAHRLELRISEKTFVTRDPGDFHALRKRDVQLVVDEAGRGMSSLATLARAPIWGLQLDRAWVSAMRNDPVAFKVCSATVNMALALGITPIATGVDSSEQRAALLELGCRYGSGDLFAPASNITSAFRNA